MDFPKFYKKLQDKKVNGYFYGYFKNLKYKMACI